MPIMRYWEATGQMNDLYLGILIVVIMIVIAPRGDKRPPANRHLRHRDVWEDRRDDDE